MKLFTPKIPRTFRTGVRPWTSDEIETPKNYDVGLSLSFIRVEYIPGLTVEGGRRSCLDIDHCYALTLEHLIVCPTGRHGIRIADRSENIWIDGVTFTRAARRSEILIGHRPGADPCSRWNPAGQVTIRDALRTDGKPVRIEVWDAPPPILINCDADIRMMNPRYTLFAQSLNRKGLLP